MDIHKSAAAGYAAAAEIYVRGRPNYPVETIQWLRESLGLGPGKKVLEVGAGTGKFIPVLRESGAEILALEPVAAMREQLVRAHGDVEAYAGTVDAIPLPDESVDVVVCAQAFHWFATSGSLASFRRVLVPGGMLGLIWNVRDESVPWVATLSAITDPLEGGTPRYRSGAWREVFPAEGFEFAGEYRVAHTHHGRPEDVILYRTLSVSFVAAQPEPVRQRVEAEVKRLIACTPTLSGRDEIDFPYETRMFSYRKVG